MPGRHSYQNTRDGWGTSYNTKPIIPFAREIPQPKLVIWYCPNPECTWYRVRTDTPKWREDLIGHPVYGNVTNYYAYIQDIGNHDCEQTRLSRIRHGFNPHRVYDGNYYYESEK